MFTSQMWNPKDDLPDVDLFLNVLVAQLCVDIDRESHPERDHPLQAEPLFNESEPEAR